MSIRTSLLILVMFVAVPLLAADPPPASTAAPVAPAATTAPAAKAGPAAAEFARVTTQWKDVLTKLTALKIDYHTADEAHKADIKKQWTELMETATALEDQLIAAAVKAYKEAPNADAKVTELLLGVLADSVMRDDFEKGYPIGKLLVEKKCPDKTAASLAGIAAFCTNQFDEAETWFTQAEKAGELTERARKLAPDIPYYKEAWAKEQKIREAEAKADDLPHVLLKTERGDIELELFENEAPNHVANFITLVEKKFYDGLTFHRVLPGFMAQGGDPKGDGTGDAGYKIAAEFTSPKHRTHFRGSLAAARSQDPDSAGSQFYLMFVPGKMLDQGGYTVYGRVVKGFDVSAKIKHRDPDKNPDDPPGDKIIKAKVLRKRPGSKYEVKKVSE